MRMAQRSLIASVCGLLLAHCTPTGGAVEGSIDAGAPVDGGAPLADAGAPRADSGSVADGGSDDADSGALCDGGLDAGGDDAGPPDAGAPCASTLAPMREAPALLSETGLYSDIAARNVAASMMPFAPQFELWSDGAAKSRWMYLPECDGVIDTSDMDAWSFPVGARAFKQFVVDGHLIETRLVHRFGPGRDDFLFAHYLWREDGSDADLVTAATPADALHHPRGTEYTVPPADACVRCHGASGGDAGGLRSRYIGFSAVQLSHAGPGVTLDELRARGRLSRPPRGAITVPGTPLQRQALGYLHANCGHCHNEGPDGVNFPASPLSFWIGSSVASVHETAAYRTSVGVEVSGFESSCTHRIHPADPGLGDPPSGPVLSCVVERMRTRDAARRRQMPPLASGLVHDEGVALIEAWIQSFGAP